jgi:hypothetical protein
MVRANQFSLGYLLLEVFWIAIAIAATRAIAVAGSEETARDSTATFAILIPFAGLFWAIAIGGLFGRMTAGAAVGFVLFWALLLFLPGIFYQM